MSCTVPVICALWAACLLVALPPPERGRSSPRLTFPTEKTISLEARITARTNSCCWWWTVWWGYCWSRVGWCCVRCSSGDRKGRGTKRGVHYMRYTLSQLSAPPSAGQSWVLRRGAGLLIVARRAPQGGAAVLLCGCCCGGARSLLARLAACVCAETKFTVGSYRVAAQQCGCGNLSYFSAQHQYQI